MGNLARQFQQEQKQKKKQLRVPKRRLRMAKKLTLGELMIGAVFSVILCIGGVQIISNQATIYHMNKNVEDLSNEIANQEKINIDLGKQIEELSTYDRILEKAKELGLSLKENNVKVVQ